MKLFEVPFLKKMIKRMKADRRLHHRGSFWAIVQKEITDYLSSWRIIILLIIILLTCLGSLYTALTTIHQAIDSSDDELKAIVTESQLFLKLFTVSDGTLPPFITFVTFLGPLLGIALGFDAINSERNRGTLTRLMAQPVPRDYVINGKFVSALIINGLLFLTLVLLVTAFGILMIGIPPTFDEFLRILSYLFLCVIYIAFWLNLGILFSIRFKQAATSALSGIALWIFFSVFYSMIVSIIAKGYIKVESITGVDDMLAKQGTMLNLMRLSPNYLL